MLSQKTAWPFYFRSVRKISDMPDEGNRGGTGAFWICCGRCVPKRWIRFLFVFRLGDFSLGVRFSELYVCLPDYIISKTSRLTAIRNMPATKPRIA